MSQSQNAYRKCVDIKLKTTYLRVYKNDKAEISKLPSHLNKIIDSLIPLHAFNCNNLNNGRRHTRTAANTGMKNQQSIAAYIRLARAQHRSSTVRKKT